MWLFAGSFTIKHSVHEQSEYGKESICYLKDRQVSTWYLKNRQVSICYLKHRQVSICYLKDRPIKRYRYNCFLTPNQPRRSYQGDRPIYINQLLATQVNMNTYINQSLNCPRKQALKQVTANSRPISFVKVLWPAKQIAIFEQHKSTICTCTFIFTPTHSCHLKQLFQLRVCPDWYW